MIPIIRYHKILRIAISTCKYNAFFQNFECFTAEKSLFLKKSKKTFGFVMRTYYLCIDKTRYLGFKPSQPRRVTQMCYQNSTPEVPHG